MASLFLLSPLSLLLLFSLSLAAYLHRPPPPHLLLSALAIPPEIHQACKASRYPDACESSLSQPKRVPPNPSPIQIIQAAIMLTSESLNVAKSTVKKILESPLNGYEMRIVAAKNCMEVLDYSQYRTSSAADAFARGKIKDARAWMSASLQYQYACSSGLKSTNGSQINQTIAFFDSLLTLSSNALSMMVSYDVHGNDTGSWSPPMTERAGFWESSGPSGPGLGFKGGIPPGLTVDVTVCKAGGNGCYKTVQDAVNAAPSNGTRRFVIQIKEGVYQETVRVPLEKTNVVFLGDGMGKTVITGSLNVGQPGLTTSNTATVGVVGDGFMASGITFENTAGPETHQAVAFRSDSDQSIVENCEFIGNQDTLYAHSLRQFYKSCRIQGNVDFIFGNSAAVFQDCVILVRPRQLQPEKGESNPVTAHGRTDPAQSTGFVFQNCSINGTEDYMELYRKNPKVHRNYLGRPWKEYSRTVFIQSNLEALITAEGWLPWSGGFALLTLYYGEFGNSGAGANLTGRVNWSSRIPAEHVNAYSVRNFIQGDQWIPTSS